jgi:hypothetical protein
MLLLWGSQLSSTRCVATALEDLANQHIFELAKKHAHTSRVVGVFTKCDKAPDPERVSTRGVTCKHILNREQIVEIVRENKEIALQNPWFVVQNTPDKAPTTFDREAEENATFSRDPWNQIPTKQRDILELKKFLANTLSSRIQDAFPDVQRRIKHLLATENSYFKSLGDERRTLEHREKYIHKVVATYQELARMALTAPDRLPSDGMKLRGLTITAMKNFAQNMKEKGHLYEFVDLDKSASSVNLSTHPLYNEIRVQVERNQGEQLTGMANPAVLKPLFIKQTSNWESIGKQYVEQVVKLSKTVALVIFEFVSSQFEIPQHTQVELKSAIDGFQDEARSRAEIRLREFCAKNSSFLLTTTNENFDAKVKQAQHERFTAALVRYKSKHESTEFIKFHAKAEDTDSKMLDKISEWVNPCVLVTNESISDLFEEIHPRATRNAEDEIHDILKAYYEASIHLLCLNKLLGTLRQDSKLIGHQIAIEYFKTHVIYEVVEQFLQDPKGPLFGLSEEYLSGIGKNQLDILGGEDELVVKDRNNTMKRIKNLEEALRIAEGTLKKSKPRSKDLPLVQ